MTELDTNTRRGIYKAAYKAAGLAFDEADFLKAIGRESARDDAEGDGGNLASRIMNAIRQSGDFSDEELTDVETALSNAGIADVSSMSEMASDEAIMRRRRQRYDAGRITLDHLHSPLPLPPASAADVARRREMFGDYDRLK